MRVDSGLNPQRAGEGEDEAQEAGALTIDNEIPKEVALAFRYHRRAHHMEDDIYQIKSCIFPTL